MESHVFFHLIPISFSPDTSLASAPRPDPAEDLRRDATTAKELATSLVIAPLLKQFIS